ncbi:MAG: hypothetical protein Ta2B_18400 [Termitinemataceae bacterium]|nr:MAG: hypothetical protein Ta2B_18400 [Termitinemataceae bacterium]
MRPIITRIIQFIRAVGFNTPPLCGVKEGIKPEVQLSGRTKIPRRSAVGIFIRENFLYTNIYNNNDIQPEYKFDFAYIAAFTDITKSNSETISNIFERQKHIQDQVYTSAKELEKVSEAFNNFAALQNEQCTTLLNGKQNCNKMFDKLSGTSKMLNDSFLDFISKIDSSAASLEYCVASDALLTDINTSFKEVFDKNRFVERELMQKIETILSQSMLSARKIENMQSFPKTYSEAIGLYSTKMESAINSFEEKNKTHQIELTKICKEYLTAVLEQNNDLKNIFIPSKDYLLKNTFVLGKILETYKNSSLNQTQLAKILTLYDNTKKIIGIEIEENDNGIEKPKTTEPVPKLVILSLALAICGVLRRLNCILKSCSSKILHFGTASTKKKNVKGTNINWTIAFAITAFVLLISMITCGSKNNKITSLETDLYRANINYSNLIESNKVYVNLLSIGNANANKETGKYLSWISKPGTRMYTNSIRKLNPEMRYTTEINGEVEFYIKIISPDGIIQDKDSPKGYSYTLKKALKKGENVYLDLYGFGEVNKSIFPAGSYRVEVWYKDVCIKALPFTIYE